MPRVGLRYAVAGAASLGDDSFNLHPLTALHRAESEVILLVVRSDFQEQQPGEKSNTCINPSVLHMCHCSWVHFTGVQLKMAAWFTGGNTQPCSPNPQTPPPPMAGLSSHQCKEKRERWMNSTPKNTVVLGEYCTMKDSFQGKHMYSKNISLSHRPKCVLLRQTIGLIDSQEISFESVFILLWFSVRSGASLNECPHEQQ